MTYYFVKKTSDLHSILHYSKFWALIKQNNDKKKKEKRNISFSYFKVM